MMGALVAVCRRQMILLNIIQIRFFDTLNCQDDKEKIAAKKELIPTKNSGFLTLYEMVRSFSSFFLSPLMMMAFSYLLR